MGIVASGMCAVCSGVWSLASCCGSTNSAGCGPQSAKIGYVALVIMSVFLAVILKNFFADELKPDGKAHYYAFDDACTVEECIENSIVYRFSLLNVLFFGAMAVFTPACEMLHLQMWQLKLPIYFVLMVVVFLFKNSAFDDYADVSRVFSIIFLFLQVILLLDFSFEMDHSLITKANKADEDRGLDPEDGCLGYFKNWIRLIYIFLLLGIWGSTIGFWVAMYDQFDCSFAQGMTSFVLVAVIIIQILGNVAGEYLAGESGQGQGMLPCAIGGLYATWLTFSALASNPDQECNPFHNSDDDQTSLWVGVTFSALSIGYMGYSFSNNVFQALGCCQKGGCCQECGDQFCYEENDESSRRLSKGTNDDLHAAAGGDVEAAKSNDSDSDSSPAPRQLSETGKCGKAGFDRLIFHITLMTCGFYMAMVLTNWAKNPKDNNWDQNEGLNTSDESMWIKLASMFMTLALYVWVIVAPFLFPNRDFGSNAN